MDYVRTLEMMQICLPIEKISEIMQSVSNLLHKTIFQPHYELSEKDLSSIYGQMGY